MIAECKIEVGEGDALSSDDEGKHNNYLFMIECFTDFETVTSKLQTVADGVTTLTDDKWNGKNVCRSLDLEIVMFCLRNHFILNTKQLSQIYKCINL
jgi:hypothetical protein